ncbi:putative D,D-dipeptide transport system permease protein DdpC [Dickeya dianthicola]|uniref:ABC transporter permease n=1 Tax=Dickeya dianthicola TaxID=204039 RepID=UPI0003AB2793|nr:ABC transporter permease [Dickeya dianthicola]ATO31390.1 Dipeptide transport system permease protein DppC [Dickeya dianthicola RNS04.9]AYC17378.1 putative D,D-dipeptide transport system permease protein DdpC [Dickeya dianthicola]MBI0440066.1 ABC transporter permease [Dickeya dianthicola]MBI0450223.1 ABC transporter permease [Dickeya dianthicola]MBI0454546.1 ABC transporter permease [Dickeya dianthicola]
MKTAIARLAVIMKTAPPPGLLPEPGPWRRWQRKILGHHGMTLGLVILGAMVLLALLAPLISPHDPYAQDVSRRLIPPVWHDKGSWAHLLGTDKLGRDYLSRLLFGARVSLAIGLVSVMLAGTIGIALGVLAGYFGGRVDAVVSYLLTVRLALPVILVALALASLVGGSVKVVIMLLGLLLWDRFLIVSRSVTRQLREAEFIAAAQTLGASSLFIMLREILPNLLGPLTVVATLEIAHAVLLEATLSFLGLGVQPPMPSWGLMVAEGKAYMFFQPWVIVIPGVVLALLVLSINLVGDGLRDVTALDGRN